MTDLTPSEPPPFDLMTATREERDHFLQGYKSGLIAGIERGRQLADDEAAALWSEAHKVVMAMAKIDSHDVREQHRHERQVVAAERHAASARPWQDTP